MNSALTSVIDGFEPIDLVALERCAHLQTRRDRKYIVAADVLAGVLAALPADVRVLEIGGRRWFDYRSVYFDTPGFDSYRLTATRRPHRFKVRTRTYLDSDLTMLEVKIKNRRGRTVKHRRPLRAPSSRVVAEAVRDFASGFAEAAPYASDLEPALTSRYRRATLVLPAEAVRVTIDAGFRCADAAGASTGLGDELVIETKTDGAVSPVDRLLWRAGYRPVKISKFATGLAALHPELPANRWSSVLRAHFGRRPRRNGDGSRDASPRSCSRPHSVRLPDLPSADAAVDLGVDR